MHPFLPLLLLTILACPACAADWPQRRGPQGDLTAPGRLEPPLAIAWRAEVGTGACSVSVVGSRVIAFGNDGGEDVLHCLDAASGEERWRCSWPERLRPRGYEGGPNATPSVHRGRVFALSRSGLLRCHALDDGHLLWQRALAEDPGVRPPNYGFSCSPLLHEDRLLLNIGSHGLALSVDDGSTIWSSGDKADGYASQLLVDFGGQPAVVSFNRSAVSAALVEDGRALWSYPWPVKHAIADPVRCAGGILVSHGYGRGTVLLRADAQTVDLRWQHGDLRCTMATPLVIDGRIYGMHGDKQERGALCCLDLDDGAVRWRAPSVRKGAMIAVGRRLAILTEGGELVIADADDDGYREHWRARLFVATCYAVPAFADGRLFVRDAEGTLLCLQPRR